MLYFIFRFIRVLRKSKIRRKEMISNFNGVLYEKEKQMNRTTKMVLGITIFFLTNNTGLMIARILILVFGPKYKKDCSEAIICINNLLVLIYTVIPFVVYYVTSQQFRDNFKSLFFSEKYTQREGRCIQREGTSNTMTDSSEIDRIIIERNV